MGSVWLFLCVSELRSLGHMGWALVQEIFWQADAEIILASPMHDFYAWHPDAKGLFSVKSAYKIHTLQMRVSSGTPRGTSQPDPIWEKIWALPCPMKIKKFVWRLAHDSLLLCMNIKRRGVKLDPICPVCLRHDEVGAHTFLTCKTMKHCWRILQARGHPAAAFWVCQRQGGGVSDVGAEHWDEAAGVDLMLAVVEHKKQDKCRGQSQVSRGCVFAGS